MFTASNEASMSAGIVLSGGLMYIFSGCGLRRIPLFDILPFDFVVIYVDVGRESIQVIGISTLGTMNTVFDEE